MNIWRKISKGLAIIAEISMHASAIVDLYRGLVAAEGAGTGYSIDAGMVPSIRRAIKPLKEAAEELLR